jgi:hypothetical protein
MSFKIHFIVKKETNNIFFYLDDVIDFTHGENNKYMILYASLDGLLFVKEEKEFWEEFQFVNPNEITTFKGINETHS